MKILVESKYFSRKYNCQLVQACENLQEGIEKMPYFINEFEKFEKTETSQDGFNLKYFEGELLFENELKYPKQKGIYKFDFTCTIPKCKCGNNTSDLEKYFCGYLFFNGEQAYEIKEEISK